MDLLILIGRILFVLLFLNSAIGHFTQTSAMTAYAENRGAPAPRFNVLAGGVLLIIGSLSILFGIWPDLGALLLFLFLIPTAFFMHAFWRETDPQARQQEMLHFLKDISLAGAALMLVGLFSQLGDELGLVLTDPLFG